MPNLEGAGSTGRADDHDFLDQLLTTLGVRKAFHDHSLRAQVLISYLPLPITLGLFVLLLLATGAPVLANPLFQAGLGLTTALLAACILVPWDRLPRGSYWIIPLLSFVVIAILRLGGGVDIPGVGLLTAFPVFWLAWSAVAPAAAIVLSFLGPLMIAWLPVLVRGGPVTASDLIAPMLIPIIMLGIAISTVAMSASMSAQQRGLQAKDAKLTDALEESRLHARLLDTVLNAVQVGVVVVDGGGHDLLMNSQQKMYHRLAIPPGIPDPSEDQLLVFGRDRSTPLDPEDRPVRRAVVGESFFDQLLWIGAGSEQRAMSVSARSMSDDDGAFAGSVVAFNDVTDLVEALAVKDDFVSSVSHELRTPLTSIIGYLDLVLEDNDDGRLPAEVVSSLSVVRRNADRLLQLVSDLLSTASGAIQVDPRFGCLADVLHSSLVSAGPQAQAAGITLVDEIPARLPATIDAARMGQVMDNLLSNAIKYSPGGGTVTVRGGSSETGVYFMVQDTGMGMSAADRNQVFTRFFRTGTVRQSAIPGVGLGLPITESIVQAHGGTIDCSSELGVGSTFTVRLPRA